MTDTLRPTSLKERMHPEIGVDDFSLRDCTLAFYGRLDAVIKPNMTLLNLGAGRGANIAEDSSSYRRWLQTFKGRVKRSLALMSTLS